MSKNYYWSGLSSETKPTGAQVPIGAEAMETDTGNESKWDGTTWRQTGTAGSRYTYQTGGTWDYGNWPNNRFVPGTVTMAASASGTTVYEAIDVSSYNGFVFEVSAIGGTTPVIKLSASLDGTNYAATLPELINLADNTVIAGATGISAIGLYALNTPAAARVKYKSLKLVQTGGAADQTCTIRYAHLWA